MASIGDSQPRPKQHAVHVLRSLGLLGSVEWLNRRWAIAKSNADNDRFCREHSDFVPPPLAAMHDAYGTISFQSYWEGGTIFCTSDRRAYSRPSSSTVAHSRMGLRSGADHETSTTLAAFGNGTVRRRL
jgi:hypothetical protein